MVRGLAEGQPPPFHSVPASRQRPSTRPRPIRKLPWDSYGRAFRKLSSQFLFQQISPYERVVLRSLEPARSQRTSTSPSPQYHDMIAGRPASVLSGGGDDATMYALGVLKWWRVAPRPAFSFPPLLTTLDSSFRLSFFRVPSTRGKRSDLEVTC